MVVTCALGILATDNFAAGSAGVPDPGTEAGPFPWLWWRQWAINIHATTVQALMAPGAVVRVDVDARAMRKLKPGQSLGWLLQYLDISGAPPIHVEIATTRVLFAGI